MSINPCTTQANNDVALIAKIRNEKANPKPNGYKSKQRITFDNEYPKMMKLTKIPIARKR